MLNGHPVSLTAIHLSNAQLQLYALLHVPPAASNARFLIAKFCREWRPTRHEITGYLEQWRELQEKSLDKYRDKFGTWAGQGKTRRVLTPDGWEVSPGPYNARLVSGDDTEPSPGDAIRQARTDIETQVEAADHEVTIHLQAFAAYLTDTRPNGPIVPTKNLGTHGTNPPAPPDNRSLAEKLLDLFKRPS